MMDANILENLQYKKIQIQKNCFAGNLVVNLKEDPNVYLILDL